ncbi:methionyl-tRNA formyltransferase [Endozoicomonas lisbonensis]|uniref:methionyl-tRNA formyltransferase n=1 Tax=Endozoicomonas lisbonensis TaxID=3120522 RepID=UPI0033980597
MDEKNPDLIIVYSMSQLLKKTTLEIPRLGVVNIHPSYLPYYKGANPWFWQYYDMLEEFGVTLHYIDEGMDTGDIIYQEKYPVPLGMKSPEMHDHAIGDIAVRMLYRLIEKISLGHELQRTKQPITKLKIARNIKPEEHSQIVSWYEWEITRVWHLLRGTESWLNSIPQPRWLYSGQRWEILDYHKCDTSDYKVGKIYKKNSKYFLVCKDGIINLKVSLKMKNTLIYILIKLGIWN